MKRLLEIMRTLRGPDGCPWDQEQTHQSLRKYLLEEASEAVDAISSENTDDIVEELGDVLLQIAFHTVIAEETERFSYEDIEQAIVAKLIRRHPHVFADVEVADAGEVVSNWQAIKAAEKADAPVLEDKVPRSLPALLRAEEMAKVMAWPEGSVEDVQRSLDDIGKVKDARTVGALLLAVVELASSCGVQSEFALREALDLRLEQLS